MLKKILVKSLKVRDHWGDIAVVGRIILKFVLMGYSGL
jgi:hypothetical protein